MEQLYHNMISATALRAAVLSGLLLLCACGHLTREYAKAQIDRAYLEGVTDTIAGGSDEMLFEVGTISEDCSEDPALKGYDPVQDSPDYAVLSAAGAVTISRLRDHLWRVELTDLGKLASGRQYRHIRSATCDASQVALSLAKYDHTDIIGIVEEGVHATVEANVIHELTPVGLRVKREAADAIFALDKRTLGEKMARAVQDNRLAGVLHDDLRNMAVDDTSYTVRHSFKFTKYDDGWRLGAN